MRRLLALTIIFVAALVVAVGFASAHGPQGNYAQGQSGVGGSWCTCGWNHRHYNRVWHQPGYAWVIHYIPVLRRPCQQHKQSNFMAKRNRLRSGARGESERQLGSFVDSTDNRCGRWIGV
jgi:hypothetical protein